MSSGFSVNLAPTVSALEAGQDAITSQLLGVGMKWHDMTAQRTPNVIYVNNHGRPIFISVVGGLGVLETSEDGGVTWVTVDYVISGDSQQRGRTIVSPNGMYRSTGSFGLWAEYLPIEGATELPAVTTLTNAQLETLVQAYIDTLNLGGGGGGGLFGTATDVLASRTHSTWYLNATGGPMLVSAGVNDTTKVARFFVSPDGGATSYQLPTLLNTASSTFIVPDGYSYQLGLASGVSSIDWWKEITA